MNSIQGLHERLLVLEAGVDNGTLDGSMRQENRSDPVLGVNYRKLFSEKKKSDSTPDVRSIMIQYSGSDGKTYIDDTIVKFVYSRNTEWKQLWEEILRHFSDYKMAEKGLKYMLWNLPLMGKDKWKKYKVDLYGVRLEDKKNSNQYEELYNITSADKKTLWDTIDHRDPQNKGCCIINVSYMCYRG